MYVMREELPYPQAGRCCQPTATALVDLKVHWFPQRGVGALVIPRSEAHMDHMLQTYQNSVRVSSRKLSV